jgi:hypothetical protein
MIVENDINFLPNKDNCPKALHTIRSPSLVSGNTVSFGGAEKEKQNYFRFQEKWLR